MNNEQEYTVLLAWWYHNNGDSIKDAFDFSSTGFNCIGDAFIALCEDHYGKDFIKNWEPKDE